MTKSIGLLGGTFDPIHQGHLAIAEDAYQQLNLKAVIFVPAGQPYFKALSDITTAEHRVTMLKLAIADKPYFKISLMEIERPGPSYTIDTIFRIKNGMRSDEEIYFIMGWDSLLTLHLWQEPERLISLCRLAVAPRPDYPNPDIKLIEKKLPGISQRTVILNNPLIDISSTEIRQRVCEGLPTEDMVPASVARYIRENGLYQKQKNRMD